MPALKNLKIAEVSFCKLGMNQHAKVALFKSMDTSPAAIAKATFQEALEGQLVASRVNEAFYSSFNGLWERNDAFRSALTDELAAGGDGATASADYVASVKALVDDAVVAARAAGANATDEELNKALTTAADNWLAAKSKPKEKNMQITTKAALLAAVAKFNPETSPAGHIAIIQKAAADLDAEDALPAEGLLAKAAPPADSADLVRKVAILEMPADVRKHFDSLTATADQDAFLKLSPDARAADVAKRNEGDPVVFTTSDGIEIRKSDGRTAELLARQNDKLNKRVDELAQGHAEATLQKRAAAYPNVAEAVAVDMLKAIDAAGGESSDQGKAMKKGLERMNGATGRLFKSIGTEAGGDSVPQGDASAKADFEKAVDAVVASDKIGRADAMSKVRRSDPVLFAKAFPDAVEPEDETEEA